LPAPKGKKPPQLKADGTPRKRGGSRKGIPNKVGADIKEMVTTALNMVGGARYLARQAEKNPAAFMGLVGKVLPLQLHASGGGAVLLEQLAMAAQALRERAQIPPPTPEDRMIDVSPISPNDGAKYGNGADTENKHKQDQ
jgi:hypothetical protein